MRNLILHLSKHMGKTVLVSSHLLSEIEVIANRMIIIHKGKKIAEGVVQEMLDPSRTLVQLDTTDNKSAMASLQTTRWSSAAVLTDKFIQLSISKNEIPALVQTLTEMNTRILAVQPRHSLEAYFLSLTNSDTHVEPFTN